MSIKATLPACILWAVKQTQVLPVCVTVQTGTPEADPEILIAKRFPAAVGFVNVVAAAGYECLTWTRVTTASETPHMEMAKTNETSRFIVWALKSLFPSSQNQQRTVLPSLSGFQG